MHQLPNGHRRSEQADCDLPGTCPSADCAATFVAYFDNCGTMLAPLPAAELGQLRRGFYTSCQELESNMQLMLDSAELAMIFHVVVLNEGAAQAGSMFLGAGGGCAARRSFRSICWLLRRRRPASRLHRDCTGVPPRGHQGQPRVLRAGVRRADVPQIGISIENEENMWNLF